MQLALATNNLDKVAEIKAVLIDLPLTVLSRRDFLDFPDIPETADDLLGNALLKARGTYEALGAPALADDTGLEVDALGGAPGVFSSRYAGEGATYADNCAKLLRELQGVPTEKRTARFRTVIVIEWGDKTDYAEGVVEGLITDAPAGAGGFGYDPVFYYPPLGKTFAEMTLEEKNEISHRGRALRAARELIIARLAEARRGVE
ncbi:MAG TPA: RdgB/HAM1 family non-canonical purine NTP pyrophosphatase [candidate division Zixibacteria bacterium]|nr:RdgB/HAM1 family non-canonical purine NTP pyrophosphatase [candidate division Zixibacteria bacterium]